MKKTVLKRSLLVLALAFVVLASFTYGIMSARRANALYHIYLSLYDMKREMLSSDEPAASQIWYEAKNTARDIELSHDQKEAIKNVATLPYLTGYNEAPEQASVTVYDESRAYNGLNFVVSAGAPKAVLMDMEGNILHEWQKNFDEIWPEPPEYPYAKDIHKKYWRRARLLNNYDILAVFEDHGLVKLDKDSNLLWAYQARCHHDLFVADNGNIYVLTREINDRKKLDLETFTSKVAILEDFVTILNPRGEELQKISLLKCFQNSEYASLLENLKVQFNIFHSNTVRPVDSEIIAMYPMFKGGDVLVSLRDLHTIAVVDLDQEKVIWALSGKWKHQHDSMFLENGNILLFDNRGNDGNSKVIEFNPRTQKTVWVFKGSPADEFFSKVIGANQRLPNGNTLIVESVFGRAFEVTPDNEVVWEYNSPIRSGDNNELVATLFDVRRVDENRFTEKDLLSFDSQTD